MKKLFLILTLLVIPSLIMATWGQGTAVKKGTYMELTATVVGSTNVATIDNPSPKRTDLIFRNPSTTYDLIIATCTESVPARLGFKLKPNETFSTQGFFCGAIYCIFDTGSDSDTIRVLRLQQSEP